MAVAVRRYADLRNARQAYSGDLLQGPPALGLLAKASAASHMHELFSCPTWAGCYQLGCAPTERWLLGLTGFQAPGDSLCGTGFWKAVRRQGARNAFASLLLLGKASWLEASAGVHIGHSGGERCALVARRCCIQWPQTFGLCLTKRKRLCTNSCENK